MFKRSRIKSRFTSSVLTGWRTNKQCLFCCCPVLIVINFLLNIVTMPSTDCYRMSCLLAINFTLLTINRLNYFKPIAHSLLISLLITIAAKLTISFSSWFLIPILWSLNYLTISRNGSLLKPLRSSFTPCEMLIVFQGIMICLTQSALCELSSFLPTLQSSCSFDLTTRTLQILFLGLTLTVISISYAARHSDLLLIYFILTFWLFLTYLRIGSILKKEPITWLLFDVCFTNSRIYLFELWACLFLFSVFFCVVIGTFGNKVPNTVIRKFFHLITIPVFATGLKYDAQLLFFLSACLLWILILLEVLRVSDPNNAGKSIEFFMDRFKNDTDRGFITLTHIYLLVGFSLSLWLSPSLNEIHYNLLSGMVTVGIGDTAAAMVGSFFGYHKWPGSNKSIEGTLGAIIFQIIFSFLIVNYLQVDTHLLIIILLSIVSSILEAKTVQIDNLLLPLYFNIIWLIFYILL